MARDPPRPRRADDRLRARRGVPVEPRSPSACSPGPRRRARSSGIEPRRGRREPNGAQRQRAMIEAGATMRETYREGGARDARHLLRGGASMSERAAQRAEDEEELRAAFEEQLRRLTPADVIVQTGGVAGQPAGRRLGLDPATRGRARPRAGARRDRRRARRCCPCSSAARSAETLAPLRDALSALQLEYARLAGRRARRAAGGPRAAPPATRRPRAASRGGGARRGRSRPAQRPAVDTRVQ